MAVLVRKSWPQSASVISILMGGGLIRKSEGLWNREHNTWHGFGPETLFDGIDDHINPHTGQPYHDGADYSPGHHAYAAGLKPHHTPFGYNPDGTLKYEDDGVTPYGHHAIDALFSHMQKKFDEAGWPRARSLDPRKIAQTSIDDHNDHHRKDDGAHGPNALPGVDSVLWRRNFAGPFNKFLDIDEMQGRGTEGIAGIKAVQTLNLNRRPTGRPGADTGRWIDSGNIPFFKSLKGNIEAINRQMVSMGHSPLDMQSMEYLRSPHINVSRMTHGTVRALGKGGAQQIGLTGRMHGEQIEDDPNANVNVLSIARSGFPVGFHSTPIKEDGTYHKRSGAKGKVDEEGNTIGGVPGHARKTFRDTGLDLSDKHTNHFVHSVFAKLMFGDSNTSAKKDDPVTGKKKSGKGGIVNTLLRGIAAEHGHENIDWNKLDEHAEMAAQYSGLATRGHEMGYKVRGGNKMAHKIAAFARMIGHDKFMNSQYTLPKHEVTIDDAEIAEKVINHLGNHYQVDAHDYGKETQQSMGHPDVDRGQHSMAPDHYKDYIVWDERGMSQNEPQTRQAVPRYEEEQPTPAPAPTPMPMSEAPSAAPPRNPTPQELGRLATMGQLTPGSQFVGRRTPDTGQMITPATAQRAQALSQPGQTMFDPYSGAWLRSRDDVLDAMDSVLKAMEDLQLNQALEDTTVMKHVPSRIDTQCNSDVGMFAKSLGLTGHDVRAIYSAQGDWSNVAKQWSVNEKTVRVIKAAMRGSFS